MDEIQSFLNYLKDNRHRIFLIFILYQIVEVYLGIVNYYFIDDIDRRVTGVTDFARTYARYFSEFSSLLVQGSRRLTDLGLTTYLLSGLILTLTSVLAIYYFTDGKKMTWSAALGSLFIGLNPWSLELMSFRFDSPYMMLSILLTFIPFLWHKTNQLIYSLSSLLCIFLMLNTYQSSSGIYIALTLFLSLFTYLSQKDYWSYLRMLSLGALSYFSAVLFYLLEVSLLPNLGGKDRATGVASLSNLLNTVKINLLAYLESYRYGLPTLWKVFVLLIVITFILIISKTYTRKLTFRVVFFISFIASIVSVFGIYLAHSDLGLIIGRPRYGYGLAILIGLLMIIVGGQRAKGVVMMVGKLAVLGLTYYSYIFSLGYVAALDNQKTDFELQSVILASSLKHYTTEGITTVHINRLFEDSPAVVSAKKNYTMLEKLIPSNTTIYWPNVMWYNEITHSSVNFIAMDFSRENLNDYTLLEDTSHFTIYFKNDNLYVLMKDNNPEIQFQEQLKYKL